MRRGDIVTVAQPGDYGKPRPAVVIQSDALGHADSLLICLITSTRRAAPQFRLSIGPTAGNGLRADSDVMVDKIMAVRRDRIGGAIGHLEAETMAELSRLLAVAIGLADPPPA